MDAGTWMQDGFYRKDRRMISIGKCCLKCTNRFRNVDENGKIEDCHTTCERYRQAVEVASEKVNRMRLASRSEWELLNYYASDKEKRRRHGIHK